MPYSCAEASVTALSGQWSPCARDAIDTYLTTLKTPRNGTHCPAVWPTKPSAQRQSPSGGLINPLPELLGTGRYR